MGGGVAAVADSSRVSMDKIDVIISHNFEIVWVLIRPKYVTNF